MVLSVNLKRREQFWRPPTRIVREWSEFWEPVWEKFASIIDQFQLSRNTPSGEALSLIRVDDDLLDSVLEEIGNMEGITSVCKIIL